MHARLKDNAARLRRSFVLLSTRREEWLVHFYITTVVNERISTILILLSELSFSCSFKNLKKSTTDAEKKEIFLLAQFFPP